MRQNEPIDWKAAYRLHFECTKISKLRVFQFKLLQRRLATNDFLKKIKLRDNDLCNFCQIEEETLIHLFWNCTVTSCFWHDFRQWLLKNESSVRSLELTPSFVIGLKAHPLFRKNVSFVFLDSIFGLVEYRRLSLQLTGSPFSSHITIFKRYVFLLFSCLLQIKCHVGGTVAGVDTCT